MSTSARFSALNSERNTVEPSTDPSQHLDHPPTVAEAGAALEAMYTQWQRSQRVLKAVQNLALDHDVWTDRAAKNALENALMRLVLDRNGGTPAELFEALERDHIACGLGCIAIDDDAAIELTTQTVRRAWLESADLPITHDHDAQSGEEALAFGEYTLPRIAPVERLLQHTLKAHEERHAVEAVLLTGMQYHSLYAETRHIGPPQRVYDMFYDWGVRNEGFASPFNARLLGKPEAGFFSAFFHTDAPFGSRGSFFVTEMATWDGAWSVDPPFLPETMRRVDAILQRWRERPDAAPVLLIVPSSYDVQVPTNGHAQLEAGVHYYEGLDGKEHLLPVDVSIHLIGEMPEFDAEAIRRGYSQHVE